MALAQKTLRVLSLFTGAGGMDVGLEQAGFHHVACLEIDDVARSTVQVNRPAWEFWNDGDVLNFARQRELFGLRPGQLDLIAGGPPCQPFSVAGQWSQTGRRGMGDLRSQTVHAMLDIFERFRPKAMMLENVQGFLSGAASARRVIDNRLEQINAEYKTGYKLHYRVVNAADYGVPQNRQRIIVLIARSDVTWEWPQPLYMGEPMTAWDAIGDLQQDAGSLPEMRGKWADLLPSIPEGMNYQCLTQRVGEEELFGYRTKYWSFLLKLAKAKPSWTLPASPGPATGPFHWDNRPLSTLERMRIQSIPDSWTICGDRRAQTKLVGNATPSLLAEIFGIALVKAITGSTQNASYQLVRHRVPLRAAPRLPVPLPESRHPMLGAKEAHRGTGKGPGRSQLAVAGPMEDRRR